MKIISKILLKFFFIFLIIIFSISLVFGLAANTSSYSIRFSIDSVTANATITSGTAESAGGQEPAVIANFSTLSQRFGIMDYLFSSITCQESWSCSDWSVCTSCLQTRTCTDSNSCGTTINKPVLSQSCSSGGSIGTSSCN